MKKLPTTKGVVIVNNNLIQGMIFNLRSKKTLSGEFRNLIKKITYLLILEAMKNIPLEKAVVKTPNGVVKDKKVSGEMPFIVSVLRAAEAMVPSVLELIPDAPVCHIGIFRDEKTLEPQQYLQLKSIKNIKERECIIVDPMLATGGTASFTISLLKKKGVKKIKLLSIFAVEVGIQKVKKDHPEVQIYCAVVDPKLLRNGYIFPGCGDAGDRAFGTIK